MESDIDYGMMAVNWEERVDFVRLRHMRLEKARAAMAASDLDSWSASALEDVRYLTASAITSAPSWRSAGRRSSSRRTGRSSCT